MRCIAHVLRHLEGTLDSSLDAFRVVVLHGARQCGKSTLARRITQRRGGTYVTLDDDATRDVALADPDTFLRSSDPPLAIDEIQLGGDRLVRAVKRLVDGDPTPGQVLLTGSTNFLTVPTISESLAGRARLLRLWPLSEAELTGRPPRMIDGWFDGETAGGRVARLDRDGYLSLACRGGYPEVVDLAAELRAAWFESYAETVLQRDIVALADVRRGAALSNLLRWTATMTGQELNVSRAAQTLGLDRATVVAYVEWLRSVFLVHELPAWSRNLTSRVARRTKVHLCDPGLAADLLGVTPVALSDPRQPATGPLLETFVVDEIAKQLSATSARIALSHYRDHRGHEIDLVLERNDGAVVAVEVKATSSPTAGQLAQSRWLRDRLDATAPGTFRAGVLLHTGSQAASVGDRLHLLPIAALWAG